MNQFFSLLSNLAAIFRNICGIIINLYSFLARFSPPFFGNICLFSANITGIYSDIPTQHTQKRKPPTEAFFLLDGIAYLARALSASAISWKIPACFLATTALMTNRVTIISAMAMIMQITTFCTRPAMMKLTKETAATVMP